MLRYLMLFTSLLFCAGAYAAPSFFSSVPLEENSGPARAAADLFKLAPNCSFSVEVADHYQRFTDSAGKSYLLRFFDDGRVAGYETDGVRLAVVWAGQRPASVINVDSGRIFKVDSGKGPDWYARMRAEGKLPNARKVVERICAVNKDYFEIQDPFILELTTVDYWDGELSGDFDFSYYWEIDLNKDCEAQKQQCRDACEAKADYAMLSCGAYGLIWSAITGPEIGGVIGLVCGAAAINNKWRCIANCDARC